MQIGNTLKYMNPNEVNKDKKEFFINSFASFRECVSVLVLYVRNRKRVIVKFEESKDE